MRRRRRLVVRVGRQRRLVMCVWCVVPGFMCVWCVVPGFMRAWCVCAARGVLLCVQISVPIRASTVLCFHVVYSSFFGNSSDNGRTWQSTGSP